MPDTLTSTFWMTVINMTVVFIVLWVLALLINALRALVSPFGPKPHRTDGNKGARGTPVGEAEMGAAGEVESARDETGLSAGEAEPLSEETAAVISAAVSAYLAQPAAAAVPGASADRDESLWAAVGRIRLMQSREIARRRATA